MSALIEIYSRSRGDRDVVLLKDVARDIEHLVTRREGSPHAQNILMKGPRDATLSWGIRSHLVVKV